MLRLRAAGSIQNGTIVKALFTIGPGWRLALLMVLIVAAALAASSPPAVAPATVQATATVRIVAAVRLKLDAPKNLGAPDGHDAVLRLSDGSAQPAKLIEFE